jgi:signal transduction histidine kinase
VTAVRQTFDPEPHLKEPLFRAATAMATVLTAAMLVRDVLQGHLEPLPFYCLILVVGLVILAAGKSLGYHRSSMIVTYGLTLSAIGALSEIGYNGEHNFFLISLLLSGLVLMGTLFLGKLRDLVGQVVLLWGFFASHVAIVLFGGQVTEKAVSLDQQLFFPLLVFGGITVLALVTRQMFNLIKREYVQLAEARLRGQESLGQLVRGLSHHLNTPLGNAKMVLSMTTDSGKGARSDESTVLLESSVDVSISLVQRLSGFMRLCDQPPQTCADHNDLRSLLVGRADTPSGWDTTAEFTRHFEIPRVYQWESVAFLVDELIDNAWRHGDSTLFRPVIRADFRGPDTLVIVVANAGKSIAPDLLPKIRDPFFSSLVSNDHPGLGLFFADYLTTFVLGGRLQIDARPEGGTIVTVLLPMQA